MTEMNIYKIWGGGGGGEITCTGTSVMHTPPPSKKFLTHLVMEE